MNPIVGMMLMMMVLADVLMFLNVTFVWVLVRILFYSSCECATIRKWMRRGLCADVCEGLYVLICTR